MSAADAPPTRVRRPHVNVWLVAGIAVAAALVGLGVWVLVDRGTSSATPGLASPEIARMLDGRLAAFNSGDAEAVAAFYTPDAVLEEHDRTPTAVTRGSEAIGRAIATYVNDYGLQLARVSPVIQTGRGVAEAVTAPNEPDWGWTLVYLLDQSSGKIAHQWVLPAQDIRPTG